MYFISFRLLERAAKLNENNGSGSLTAFPIVETQAGDVSAHSPAVNVGLSNWHKCIREIARFEQFSSNADAVTTQILKKGKLTIELLKQVNNNPMAVGLEALMIFAMDLTLVRAEEIKLLEYINSIDSFKLYAACVDALKVYNPKDTVFTEICQAYAK
ncbi:hypothetical protein ACTFIY_009624 [Dictyostelium cf. discoideum]